MFCFPPVLFCLLNFFPIVLMPLVHNHSGGNHSRTQLHSCKPAGQEGERQVCLWDLQVQGPGSPFHTHPMQLYRPQEALLPWPLSESLLEQCSYLILRMKASGRVWGVFIGWPLKHQGVIHQCRLLSIKGGARGCRKGKTKFKILALLETVDPE